MRLAIHASTLTDIFNGVGDPLTTSAILASKISVTASVLQEYQQNLPTNTSFVAWFTATQSSGRFSLHFPQHAPALVQTADGQTDSYATAAYFAGGQLAVEPNRLPANAIPTLMNVGVETLSHKIRTSGPIHGDNPYFTITTRAGGNLDFSVLNRFFLPEARVVVYDKYINAKSAELLSHVATLLAPGSEFCVLHAGNGGAHLLNSNAISTALQQANPNIQIVCKTASPTFLSLAHDRYIFLGTRIQMVFSAGLDCFGPISQTTGMRTNRQSMISLFNVTEGEPLVIEASDGTTYAVQHIAELA